MDFHEKRILGKTGLKVGRLGISSSFGAPAQAFEEAFDKGCNYFTWGTFIKGRSDEMKKAVKNIVANGRREDLVLAFFTYAHNSYLTETFLKRGLNSLGIDYIDVLLLGWFNKRPGRRIMNSAYKLKQKGLVRHIGLSSHKRTLFPQLLKDDNIDVFHVRYNAAHIGAETDIFPYLNGNEKPGLVSFTATRWRQLLDPKKMPKDEKPPTATDCYRFVLSNPSVDVCMVGAKNLQQMRENLTILDKGSMKNEELARMRKIGEFMHRKKLRF